MRRAVSLALAVGLAVPAAFAAPITYVETTTSSGSLGGTPFTGAALTFTQVADTADVTNPSSLYYYVADMTSTVTIAGLGLATFTIPTNTFNNGGFAGLVLPGPNQPLIVASQAGSAFLGGYDLRSTFGPVSGTGLDAPGLAFSTDRGDFVLTSDITATTTTFQATLGAVPEPSSVVMAGVSILAGLGYAWRRLATKRPAG